MHHAEVCIAQSSIIVFIRVPCFGNQKSIFGAIMKSIAHSFCFMKQVSIGIEIEYALMYRRMFTKRSRIAMHVLIIPNYLVFPPWNRPSYTSSLPK